MINIYRYKDLLDESSKEQKKNNLISQVAAAAEDSDEAENDEKQKKKVLGEADAFIKFKSCAIEEIKSKAFAEPEKYKETSVFIASRE